MLPILYGADWCPDCRRAKTFLDKHGVDYDFVDVDLDREATALVERINDGKRIIPTICHYGRSYTNPENGVLADVFGINETGRVRYFGADWCPDCRRAKRHLRDHGIRYEEIDVDAHPWAADFVEGVNGGKRIIPTFLIDGTPYSNPDNATLTETLQLDVAQEHQVYDVVIVGGGAAGLTTAIYAQRDRFDCLLLERKAIGGNTFLTEKIENYPGFIDISGPDLMERMEQQAVTYGTRIETGVDVTRVEPRDTHFLIHTNDKTYEGRSVVIATGSTYRRLKIPGERELLGSGVHFCATCDGAFYRDKEVIVIGGGNSALEEGIFLTSFTSHVKLVHRGPELSADAIYTDKLPGMTDKLTPYLNRTPVAFEMDENGGFLGLRVKDNASGEEEVLTADGAFVFIGLIPNTKPFAELIELDERGFVCTGDLAQTSVDGIFAAGDLRHGAIAQVAAATGEGVLASYGLRAYLRSTK